MIVTKAGKMDHKVYDKGHLIGMIIYDYEEKSWSMYRYGCLGIVYTARRLKDVVNHVTNGLYKGRYALR